MRYQFRDCTLDTDRRELRRADLLVAVEPQVFDMLEFLIRTRDRVASRDDLLEAVWNGRIVSESTLSSRINAARVAIGDDGTAQLLIRTCRAGGSGSSATCARSWPQRWSRRLRYCLYPRVDRNWGL